MKRMVVLWLFAAGLAQAEEWEEREERERERMEAFEEEREVRHRVRMEAFGRALQKEISVEFDGESLGDAIKFISNAAGMNVAVHKDVELDEGVTLKLTELPVHAVLETLARVCDLRLELEGGVVLFLPQGEERNEIGKLWLEFGPFEMELRVSEDDVPPDLRHDLVRRALRMMHGMGERREGRVHPRREEERRRREHEREELERERERREPEHERRERGEEF
jgi:hypothetical protein